MRGRQTLGAWKDGWHSGSGAREIAVAEAARKPMTADEFPTWDAGRDGRHELVDGFVIRMMTGTRRAHDRITGNVLAYLHGRLRYTGCTPHTDDLAVRAAASPRAVFAVLSPSTRVIDMTGELDECRRVGTSGHVVPIDPDRRDVKVWSRDGGDWASERLRDPGDVLRLASIDAEWPLGATCGDAGLGPDEGPIE